jgi:hypothetical protein
MQTQLGAWTPALSTLICHIRGDSSVCTRAERKHINLISGCFCLRRCISEMVAQVSLCSTPGLVDMSWHVCMYARMQACMYSSLTYIWAYLRLFGWSNIHACKRLCGQTLQRYSAWWEVCERLLLRAGRVCMLHACLVHGYVAWACVVHHFWPQVAYSQECFYYEW